MIRHSATARRPAVLAIDLGTTHAKAGVVSLDGRLLGSGRFACDLYLDKGLGIAEQDVDGWWTAAVGAAREALAGAGEGIEIVGIGVDGHGPSVAALAEGNRPVRPAITWMDTRPRAELAELESATGLLGWSLGVLPSALWISHHDPTAASRTRWYLNTWEYLGLRLAGVAATTVVAGQPVPDRAALGSAGLDIAAIPPTIAAGAVLGGLTPEAAGEIGVRPGTPIVAGHNDAFASMLGAGLRSPGDAFDAGGTAGGFGVYWSEPVMAAGDFCGPGPLPGLVFVGGAMAATGAALDWFHDVVGAGAGHRSDERSGIEALIDDAASTEPGAGGLVFLPYLAGERSPLWDPTARGAFLGLGLEHRRGDLVRAILEGAAFAIRHVARPIVDAGVRVDRMVVTGGPARSPAWNQIKADVTGFAVDVPEVVDAAVLGSAIWAAVGVGAHADLATAIAAMTRVTRRVLPRPELAGRYARAFEAYVRLQPAIGPILAGLPVAEPGMPASQLPAGPGRS